jgi:hypothetical protein
MILVRDGNNSEVVNMVVGLYSSGYFKFGYRKFDKL